MKFEDEINKEYQKKGVVKLNHTTIHLLLFVLSIICWSLSATNEGFGFVALAVCVSCAQIYWWVYSKQKKKKK